MAAVRGLPLVADNVHSTDHLADGKETDNLGSSDTGQGDLLRVCVADAGEDVLGGTSQGLEGGGLKVGLEGGHGTGQG